MGIYLRVQAAFPWNSTLFSPVSKKTLLIYFICKFYTLKTVTKYWKKNWPLTFCLCQVLRECHNHCQKQLFFVPLHRHIPLPTSIFLIFIWDLLVLSSYNSNVFPGQRYQLYACWQPVGAVNSTKTWPLHNRFS